MKTETEKQIEAAEAVESEAFKAYAEAREGVFQLKKQFALETFGVQPGTIVTLHAQMFKVVGVDTFTHPRKPWVNGVKKKKDGTFMARPQCLYADWELVDHDHPRAKGRAK